MAPDWLRLDLIRARAGLGEGEALDCVPPHNSSGEPTSANRFLVQRLAPDLSHKAHVSDHAASCTSSGRDFSRKLSCAMGRYVTPHTLTLRFQLIEKLRLLGQRLSAAFRTVPSMRLLAMGVRSVSWRFASGLKSPPS